MEIESLCLWQVWGYLKTQEQKFPTLKKVSVPALQGVSLSVVVRLGLSSPTLRVCN